MEYFAGLYKVFVGKILNSSQFSVRKTLIVSFFYQARQTKQTTKTSLFFNTMRGFFIAGDKNPLILI